MLVEEFRNYIAKVSFSEAFTVVLTIHSNRIESQSKDTKAKIILWAKQNGIRTNVLPGFPHLIAQTSTENWARVLGQSETQKLLSPESVDIALNEDVAFVPDIEIFKY